MRASITIRKVLTGREGRMRLRGESLVTRRRGMGWGSKRGRRRIKRKGQKTNKTLKTTPLI